MRGEVTPDTVVDGRYQIRERLSKELAHGREAQPSMLLKLCGIA